MKFVLAAYGSRGDIEPCTAVGRELLRRGHEVRMAVPPDKVGFVESAGLDAVAYGPDTHDQMNMAADFVRNVPNPISALPQIMESVIGVWAEKSTTLASLADGADLLVAGMNEQRLAANVAEHHDISLAALHFFPARVLELGWLQSYVTKQAEDVQRRALGLAESTESSTRQAKEHRPLEIQAYDELCTPGLAAEWAEASD